MRALFTTALGIAAAGILALGVGAGEIYEVDYAGHDVSLTDSKGVQTDLTDFAYWTGPNILIAMRGDARVEIPFRGIRTLEIGRYEPVKGFSQATVTTAKGRSFKVQIERFEGQRYLGGTSEFGNLRIRLMQIARLELRRLSHTAPEARP